MIQSPIVRLLLIPILSLTLQACNLSAGTAIEIIETPETILTATPLPQATLEVTSLPTKTAIPSTATPTRIPVSNNTTTTTGDLYYVYGKRPQNICAVKATITTNIRTTPDLSASIKGQLVGDEWIPVFNQVNDWYQINLPNTPVHQLWISTAPTTLDSTCLCDEGSCQHGVTKGPCDLTTHPDTTTEIRTEPSNWSEIVGELLPETRYSVIAQSSSGWYQLETGGWIPPSYVKSPSEGCANLITITYDAPLLECDLVNTTNEIAVILRDPDGEYFGRFGVGLKLGIIKKEGDWYQVYVPAFENAGWVNGSKMSLEGTCDKF